MFFIINLGLGFLDSKLDEKEVYIFPGMTFFGRRNCNHNPSNNMLLLRRIHQVGLEINISACIRILLSDICIVVFLQVFLLDLDLLVDWVAVEKYNLHLYHYLQILETIQIVTNYT